LTKPSQQTTRPALAVIITLGLFLVVTSAFYPLDFLSVLDAKRVLQMGVFVALILFAASWAPLRNATYVQLDQVARFDAITFALFLIIGLVSALRLLHPAYALMDVSIIFVMLLLIFVIAASREISGIHFDRWAVLLLAVMGLAVSWQEFMGILVGWVTGKEFSYQQALMHFAHPRFFNHLQTWSIPVLAALPLMFARRRGIKSVCIFLLGLQWFLVILNAARGTTVALLTAMVIIAFWLPAQRRFWLRYQFAGLLTALVIYAIVLSLNNLLVPQSGSFYSNSIGRPMAHTSGRTVFWRESLKDAFNHPVLGTGPTRYACEAKRSLPAHPHSFPLRIIGEWGFIAFILMLILASRTGASLLKKLKTKSATSQTGPPLQAMLATSLIAGVIHACLSGVLIMPASQIAMILIAGWTLSLTGTSTTVDGKSPGRRLVLTAGLFLACAQFLFTAWEIPNLEERTVYSITHGPMMPRFWQNGRVCDYVYPDVWLDPHK